LLAFAAFLGVLLLFSGANADHHKKNKDSDALTTGPSDTGEPVTTRVDVTTPIEGESPRAINSRLAPW
jgi:hypothetical protein